MTNTRKRQRTELSIVNYSDNAKEPGILLRTPLTFFVEVLKRLISLELQPYPRFIGHLHQVNKNLYRRLDNIAKGHDEYGFWSYVFSHTFIEQYHGFLHAGMAGQTPTFWYSQFRNQVAYRYLRNDKQDLLNKCIHHVRYDNAMALLDCASQEKIFRFLTLPLNKINSHFDLIFVASQHQRTNILKLFYDIIVAGIENEDTQVINKQLRLTSYAVRCGQTEQVANYLKSTTKNSHNYSHNDQLNLFLQDAIHYGHINIVKLLKSQVATLHFNLAEMAATSATYSPELVTALVPAASQATHSIACPFLKMSTQNGHWVAVEALAPAPRDSDAYRTWKSSWLTTYADEILKIAAKKGHATQCEEALKLHRQQPLSVEVLEFALLRAIDHGHLAIAKMIAPHVANSLGQVKLTLAIRTVIIADDAAMLCFIHQKFPGSEQYEIQENMHTRLNQLLFASHQASRMVVEYLITEQHFVINQQKQGGSNQGYTALHYAVRNQNISVVMLLLKLGADVNKGDCHYETPLHLAVRENNVPIIRYLLTKNADVTKANRSNETPLDLSVRNQKSSFAASEALIAHHATGTDVLHTTIKTHLRADGHKYHLIECLLATKRFDPNEQNQQNLTPLEVAAKSCLNITKQISTIELLIKHGASPLFAIANAIKQKYIGCAKTIVTLLNLTRANPQQTLSGELLPVMDNCDTSLAREIAANLWATNVDRTNPKEEQLRQAFFFAVLAGDPTLINDILESNNVSVDATRFDGASALVIAAANGHNSIVKLLIEKYNANTQQAVDYLHTHEQWLSGRKILSYWHIRMNHRHQSIKQQILLLLQSEATTRILQSAIQPYGTFFQPHFLHELADINDNDIPAILQWLRKNNHIISIQAEDFIKENILLLPNNAATTPNHHSVFFLPLSHDIEDSDLPELNDVDMQEWINSM